MTKTNERDGLAGENPFKREERYIVIKRKELNLLQEGVLRTNLREAGIHTVECVVVESDWPEYETVWSMIEARVTGQALTTAAVPDEPSEVERVARIIAPQAWERRAHFQSIIDGTAERMPDDPEKRGTYVRSATRRVDSVVQPSLDLARKILAATPSQPAEPSEGVET